MQATSLSSPSRSHGLLDLSDEFLALALALREGHGFGSAEEVRESLTGCLVRLESAGLDAGLPREVLTKVKYPLVAFADEIILNSGWEHVDTWRHQPLQLDLFNERMAGSGFFDRLETYRQDPAAHQALLEVYHVVLTLGFQGKFRLAGQDQLQRLVVEMRQQLGYGQESGDAKLSPHGKQRDNLTAGGGDGFPYWRVAGIAAGVLIVLFVAFFIWLDHSASEAIELLPRPEY
jgi:type VI secretion system protein ImpK